MPDNRLAVLAPFHAHNDAYSLCAVVADQVRAMKRRGMDIRVWTLRGYVSPAHHADIADLYEPCIASPSGDSAVARSAIVGESLDAAFREFQPRWVISHDVCFQRGYDDFGRAVHETAHLTKSATWFHWVHSGVGIPPFAAPTADDLHRRRVPDRHFVIFPNHSDMENVRACFGIRSDRAFSCPNSRDIRSFGMTDEIAKSLSYDLDLAGCDIVQVYPFCTTRTDSKGVRHVAAIFAELKRLGHRVCLVMCNAHSSGRADDIAAVKAAAPSLTADELVFTSDRGHPDGVPNSAVSDLMRFANLFVFPTTTEACPLVMVEAALNGCLLVVNENVPSLVEYAPKSALLYPFDALGKSVAYAASADTVVKNPVDPTHSLTRRMSLDPDESYRLVMSDYAVKIASVLASCPSNLAKRHALKVFSHAPVGAHLEGILLEAESRLARIGSLRRISSTVREK